MRVKSGTMTRQGAKALVLVAAIALAGCQPLYENHGYVPPADQLAGVQVGKTTRDELDGLIGRPSSSGVLAGSGWYYVQSRWRTYGAFAPKEVDRQVVAISFDGKGVVSDVARYGLDHGEVVTLSRRVTESNIKGIGVVRQLMGSFGRISPDQALGHNDK